MALFDIEQIAQSLSAARREWRDAHNRLQDAGEREFPSRDALAQVVHQLKGALFPMRLGPYDLRQESEDFYVAHTLDSALHALHVQIGLELRYSARQQGLDGAGVEAQARQSAQAFAQSLPAIRRLLDSDVLAAYQGDPAARSVDEVLLCYPGILAMIHHRLAHRLYQLGLPLLARIVAELARSDTGIDIHPGAQIGEGLFIDHGTGIVIGETAEIGDNVTLYQGVTLGGTGKEKGKRHPTVGNNVVIASGAKVLGSFKVGDNSKIGAGSVVLKEVPPNSTVVGIPGRIVWHEGRRIDNTQTVDLIDLDHNDLPDPIVEMMMCMQRNMHRMEKRIGELEEELKKK